MRETTVRRRALAAGVAVLAFVVVAAGVGWRAAQRLAPLGAPIDRDWAMTDFRDTVYYPAVAYRDGRDPYAPSFAREYPVQRPLPAYGPLIVLLHLPLTLLPVHAAEAAYFAVSLALTLAVAALALHGAGLPRTVGAVFGVATAMLVSRPGHKNLLLGQATLEVVAGAYLALAYARTRPFVAALGLALTTMKPQFAVPLSALLLVARAHRVVVVGLAIAGVLSLATLAANGGPSGVLSWPRAFVASSAAAAHPAQFWYLRIDFAHVLRTLGLAASGWMDAVASLGALALGATAVARARLADEPLTSSALALTALCLTTLVATYHMAYDALLLTMPILALTAGRDVRALGAARIALVALMLVPAFNWDLPAPLVHAVGVSKAAVAVANGAALFAALVLCAWLLRRRAPLTAR